MRQRNRSWVVLAGCILLPALYIAIYYAAVFSHGAGWISDVQARRLSQTVYWPVTWSNHRYGKLPGAERMYWKGIHLKWERRRAAKAGSTP